MVSAIQQGIINLYEDLPRSSLNLILTSLSGYVAIDQIRRIVNITKTIFLEHPEYKSSFRGWMCGINISVVRSSKTIFLIWIALKLVKIGMKGLWKSANTTSSSAAIVEEDIASPSQLQAEVQALNLKNPQVVSRAAGQICNSLIYHSKRPFQNLKQFEELRIIMEQSIDDIAEELDPNRDVIGNTAYNKLGARGLRERNWRSIAARLGFREQDFPFISLKLAEKGIYTEQHLQDRGILVKGASVEYIVDRTIYELSPRHLQRQMVRPELVHYQETFWTKGIRNLGHLDELAARVFAVSFKVFTLCMFVLTLPQMPLSYALVSVIAGYYWYYPDNPSLFVRGDLIDRVIWVFLTLNPWYRIFSTIGQGMRQDNIPLTLYYEFFG